MKHELTLTLRPRLYSMTARQQFDLVSPLLKQQLIGYKYTMIAELTEEHNVHYHALIEIEGQLQREALLNKLRSLHKYLGRKSFKCVQFEESYEKYIQKDLKKTSAVISDPVVKDDYGIFVKDLFSNYSKATEKKLLKHSDEFLAKLHKSLDPFINFDENMWQNW